MASWVAIGCALLLAACGRIGFVSGGSDEIDGGGSADGATGDSGPLLDCTTTHPGALLCSGFEEQGMNGWDYMILDQGTVTRSTERAYRGTTSLEIETSGVDAYKAARWGKNYVFDELISGDMYMRMYYWLSSETVVTDQLSILVVANGAEPFPSANVLLVPGEMHSSVDGRVVTGTFEFPRDRWACLIMHVAIGPSGSLEVTVDGVRAMYRAGFDTRVPGGYTNVDIGVHYATPSQGAAHFWIDEVVIDTAPVTCN